MKMRKAQKKFTLYAVMSVFVLLTILLGTINGVNFTMAAQDADQITQRRPFFEQKEVLFYSHAVNILRKEETSKMRTSAYVFRMYTENNHLNLHTALWFPNDPIYMITFDGCYLIDFS